MTGSGDEEGQSLELFYSVSPQLTLRPGFSRQVKLLHISESGEKVQSGWSKGRDMEGSWHLGDQCTGEEREQGGQGPWVWCDGQDPGPGAHLLSTAGQMQHLLSLQVTF